MILTDRQIEEAYRRGDILINPFDQKQIQPATYDLRVGDQEATTSTKKLINVKDVGYFLLEPGDFGVLTVLEEVCLGPQYAGRFGLRSKYARKGLIATTGPQIDPGFHRRLIVGITNLTPRPVSLPYKDEFVSVEFHRLEEATTKPYRDQYQDKLEPGADEVEFVAERESIALSELLTTLRSLTQDVAALASEMKTLRWVIPLFVSVGIAIMGILAALKR